jgi:copper chaperone CopZ
MDTVPGYGKLSGRGAGRRRLMTSVMYQVTGMTCEHCVRAVSGELKALDGVSDVTVVLVPGEPSTVTVTSDRPLARQAVADALDEAGDYQLAGS